MKIAGALETGVFSPLGSHRQLHSDFRLVVSSSKSPEELEEKSLVDKSFLHICTTFVIHIPPLRKRKEDIIPLVQHFLKKMGAPAAINSRTREKLLSYSWPGNVRELKNIVEREVLIKGELTEDLELPYQLKSLQIQLEELAQKLPTLEELELWYIKKVLDYTRGNRSKAAKILGISRKTLFNKLKKEK
jgi:DNA-binding NtrC family response regulator